MKRSWWTKFIFFLVLAVLAGVTVTPTALGLKEDTKFPVSKKINLGLDLQGGLYIVLGIDFNKVYKDEIRLNVLRMVDVLKDVQIQASIGEADVTEPTDPYYELLLVNPADSDRAKDKIKEWFGANRIRLTKQNGASLFYGLHRTIRVDIEKSAVSKSIEVIRNRIDEFGVTEPEIISLGSDRIVIQLPGVKDIDRAKDLIGRTAKLEFRMANDEFPAAKLMEALKKAKDAGIVYKKGDRYSDYLAQVNDLVSKDLPSGHTIAFERKVNKFTNELESEIPYLLKIATDLTGEDLQDARVNFDPNTGNPYVSLNFNGAGANKFERLTSENIGKRMAIVLDGNVYSAPNINERIGGGSAQITLGRGNRTDLSKEAADLALILRAGALPVELEFQEQRIVGPSLGSDSVEKAKLAGMIGSALVFFFILIYYKMSGAIAIFTLTANVLFVLAALVGLDATLTLPGIAGIALTVGMAVDANIIIYERIKEELAAGAAVLQAIEAGFGKAFWTILDANLTTAVAGLALLNFGTGPIRGFAVTLIIGIMATVYTSYFVSSIFFEFYMDKVKGQNLSI